MSELNPSYPGDDRFYLRLFELLEQAQDWPESEREARAAELCAEGPVSAVELMAALEGSNQLDGFLETPAWEDGDPGGEVLRELGADDGEGLIGRQVGRYHLLQVLGSGGMGQVFLAEQENPRRQVALKLIRPEAVSETAVERFRAEQQALARLNHPNIAQFFDTGVTDEGRPFFAMEWVEGQPIGRWTESSAADLDKRLRLFLDVCAAVHHAHQKQIIHRDLKPSNVLVREIDGRAVVKVIDFGIAEVLDRPTTLIEADSGGVYGTPDYLSPESFEGDVDTRADIYALGVLLYELVTGTRPFRRQELSVAEWIVRIQRGDKTPASVQAATSGTSSESWARRLAGDLDAIIDHALAPRRADRYGSVVDLVSDVERFLGSFPISVREPGTRHRLSLLFRRRRGPVIAALIACLSIVAGVGAGTFGLMRARQEAESARQALQESEAMTVFLAGLFEQSDPSRAQGEEMSARELLDQGVERLETDLQEQPTVRGQMTRIIGDVYAKLGHHDQAEALLQESLSLFETAYGNQHPESARSLSGLGVLKAAEGDLTAAEDYFERTLAVLETDPQMDPNLMALTVYHLGAVAFREQRFADAAESFERACDLWQTNQGDPEYVSRCLDALGVIRLEQNRPREAIEYSLRSLRLREETLGPDHLHVAASHESYCTLARNLMLLSEAEASCRRSLAIRSRALGETHVQVSRVMRHLSAVLRLQGDYDEAESLLHRARNLDLSQGRDGDVARAWIQLGWISWIQGRYGESERRYREATALLPESFEDSSVAAIAQHGLGMALWKQGQLDQAQELIEPTLRFQRERNGETGQLTAWPLWSLAGIHRDRGTPEDWGRAEPLYRQALEIRRALFPENHEYRAIAEADYHAFQAMRQSARSPSIPTP